jgi:hypothetical protein
MDMVSIMECIFHYRKTIECVHSYSALMQGQGTVWHIGQQLRDLLVVMDR